MVPKMTPQAGDRVVRFVGDALEFRIQLPDGVIVGEGWVAFLRTTLGGGVGSVWSDLPMVADPGRPGHWFLRLVLTEPGFFLAKCCLKGVEGWLHWPEGQDLGIAVHADHLRTGNTIYCSFVRLMGATKEKVMVRTAARERECETLDERGYAVIPPSGKLRDLVRELPHIVERLGCRYLHLLPVNPTPTTLARMGRFGSPYAALDLTGIDPALVEFDRRTTGVEQFEELTAAAHGLGARVILDLVINHTGWGSTLYETQPGWFRRTEEGEFESPGAWGNTWADLVELRQDDPRLWDVFAEAFLIWCRRGVDGFRCDAGYKVPMVVWRHIVDRVQREFPETLFLLEGLGGGWWDTAALLTDGGMQWAYSELFQEFSGTQVSGYLDHALAQSGRVGVLVHYSETHDNNRLAEKGRVWSLLRNRLSGLTSVGGAFGFTSGVEWLATEKIRVHDLSGLNWGAGENLLDELGRLNGVLLGHPAFFDGAQMVRLSPAGSPVYALLRVSAEGVDAVLVVVNTDPGEGHVLTLEAPTGVLASFPVLADWWDGLGVDLLGQPSPELSRDGTRLELVLGPGDAYCLGDRETPRGVAGGEYRRLRAQAAWGFGVMGKSLELSSFGAFDWRDVAGWVARGPEAFVAAVEAWGRVESVAGGAGCPAGFPAFEGFPRVVVWRVGDARRELPVPWGHWLLVCVEAPCTAWVERSDAEGHIPVRRSSVEAQGGHWCAFEPMVAGSAVLVVQWRIHPEGQASGPLRGSVLVLRARPEVWLPAVPAPDDLVLLTNGRGGMARVRVDLGRVCSKYDCLLGANLHPTLPVDRHVFVKRMRVWARAADFITELNQAVLVSLGVGRAGRWEFEVPAGGGKRVSVVMQLMMARGRNEVRAVFRSSRVGLGDAIPVALTVRVDLEDRSFHGETLRNEAAEHHFSSHIHRLGSGSPGFSFVPSLDRQLVVEASSGVYHDAPEWSTGLAHPVEASRGQQGSGDAYSPGWFELPLGPGDEGVELRMAAGPEVRVAEPPPLGTGIEGGGFLSTLLRSLESYLVVREGGVTVVAGYPWFLDWGRDSLICARGMLAAGRVGEVARLLQVFGGLERGGTFPNTLNGADASNRDTSDAPLWFGVVVEELDAVWGRGGETGRAGDLRVPDGRCLRDVVLEVAEGYLAGTANGIRVDAASGLVWSPPHFTWMDTNHPAGTPREGYPLEIQALWIRVLRWLDREGVGAPGVRGGWRALADRAAVSVDRLFWMESPGWYADVLRCGPGVAAVEAQQDDALRSNGLLAIALGVITGERARRQVSASQRHLVVPGAVRSLAPIPVKLPLVIERDGWLLNDPMHPYWSRYEGDEDTHRKPAYHNGTAWTWMYPVFCEALWRAWDCEEVARVTAVSYLDATARLLGSGCLGHLPEIRDGDAPHRDRGCDAQAWGLTEALRVAVLLESGGRGGSPVAVS